VIQPADRTVEGLLQEFAARRLSPVEALDACAARIDAVDGLVGGFTALCLERAREEAHAAEAAWSRGEARPLEGVPFAVKDLFDSEGVRTAYGSPMFAEHVPTRDAEAVARARAAGAILVGKTQTHEFAWGITSVNELMGSARNPWALERVSGGSSGGSAVVLAAGEVPLTLGSDTGGSIRVPASFCGIVGLKPTYGRISAARAWPLARSLDHPGPMATTPAGAALLLEAIAGDDWRDPQWVRGPIAVDRYSEAEDAGVEGLRIGVIEESLAECDLTVRAGLDRAVAALSDAGAVVERFSLPIWAEAFAVYQPLVAHLIANTIRSEGVGFGHLGYVDVERAHAFALARRSQSADLNPYVKCWMLADRFLHERHHNVTYGLLQNQRLLVRRRISEALEDHDLLLTPTVPGLAPRLFDEPPSIDELLAHSPADVAFNTAPLNLSGHPALSIPTTTGGDGSLPTAVQLVAPHFAERTAFRAAFALESALGPFE
jgi:amidase